MISFVVILFVAIAPIFVRGLRLSPQRGLLIRKHHNLSRLTATTSNNPHDESLGSFLERMLSFIFEALPAAMAPFTMEMDESKIIKNPPKVIMSYKTNIH
jgi:hypothetical protein